MSRSALPGSGGALARRVDSSARCVAGIFSMQTIEDANSTTGRRRLIATAVTSWGRASASSGGHGRAAGGKMEGSSLRSKPEERRPCAGPCRTRG